MERIRNILRLVHDILYLAWIKSLLDSDTAPARVSDKVDFLLSDQRHKKDWEDACVIPKIVYLLISPSEYWKAYRTVALCGLISGGMVLWVAGLTEITLLDIVITTVVTISFLGSIVMFVYQYNLDSLRPIIRVLAPPSKYWRDFRWVMCLSVADSALLVRGIIMPQLGYIDVALILGITIILYASMIRFFIRYPPIVKREA